MGALEGVYIAKLFLSLKHQKTISGLREGGDASPAPPKCIREVDAPTHNKGDIRVLLYSYYTAIIGGGGLLMDTVGVQFIGTGFGVLANYVVIIRLQLEEQNGHSSSFCTMVGTPNYKISSKFPYASHPTDE